MSVEYQIGISNERILPQTITVALSTSYGITAIGDMGRMSGGLESSCWLVSTDSGDRVIVKVYGGKRNTHRKVAEEVDLYDYLNLFGPDSGFKVPEVRSTIDDEPTTAVLTNHGSRQMIVMKYEGYRPYVAGDIDYEDMSRLGAVLANIHDILVDYPGRDQLAQTASAENPWYRNWGVRAALRSFVGRPTLYDITQKHSGASLVLAHTGNMQRFTEEEWERIKGTDEKVADFLNGYVVPDDLTVSVIHHDLKLRHVLFRPNGDFYIYDWANRSLSPVAQELGVLLLHLYRESNITFERWQQLKGVLLTGYNSEAQLQPKEVDAVDYFIFGRCVDVVRHFCMLTGDLGREIDAQDVRRIYDLADRLLDSH